MRSTRPTALRALPNERRLDRPDELPPETVRAASRGDDTAFGDIVRFYYPRCLRFATRIVLNRDDAEDCVQDTFVRLHRALPRYEERQRFNAWVFRILANRCRTMLHRAQWRLTQIAKFEVPSTCTHDEGLGTTEVLARAINLLSSENREAFLLRHVEGFSYEQIASITGVTVTAARMRVSRACARLRATVVAATA